MERMIQPRGRKGFTLIEILAVLAIMMLMMGMAMFAFVDFGAGAKMRASVLQFKGALSQARQNAITHRVRTYVLYGNYPTRGWYVISNEVDGVMGVTNVIGEGVAFDHEPGIDSWALEFKLDGSCDSDCDNDGASADDWDGNQRKIILYEHARAAAGGGEYLSTTVQVFRLTGTVYKTE